MYKESGKSTKTVFSGPGELEIGPAPEFNDKEGTLNPEEMFVANKKGDKKYALGK